MQQVHDRKIRIFGMPLIALFVILLNHYDAVAAGNIPVLLWWYGVSLVNTIAIWEGCRKIMIFFLNKYPHYLQTRYRLTLQSFCILVYLLGVTYILDELLCSRIHPSTVAAHEPFVGFQSSLIPTVIVALSYETAFFFTRWKEYMIKTESLARANVQSQLDALKSQIDPHFLFNSLNTLAALIDDDNLDAQEYLSKLADVYRYVLVNKAKNTVSVAEEIQFIEAYIYLNKTRFRENLKVNLAVPTSTYSQRIAPLSLQILVENAIKHNIVSAEKPLNITILCQDNFLVVENNLQEKRTFEQSTKVGLENIKNRYALLCQTPIEIIKTTQFFTVRLPILATV